MSCFMPCCMKNKLIQWFNKIEWTNHGLQIMFKGLLAYY